MNAKHKSMILNKFLQIKDGEMCLCFQRNKKNWLVMDINCCNIYLMDLKVL